MSLPLHLQSVHLPLGDQRTGAFYGKDILSVSQFSREDLDYIFGVAETMRPQLDAKRQRLALVPADHLPPVWADADRVTQVLVNLLSNAAKYTPEGGEVAVHAHPEGPFVRVDVRDTGGGLTPEEQARLFTKFFRADTRDAHQALGTGLGLAITRELVELHGGEIGVQSTPGEGSTFSFTLPVRDATEGAQT